VHIRAFETRRRYKRQRPDCYDVRISNVKDYPADFLSKWKRRYAASLCELAKERVIFVAVEGNAIVGTASLAEIICTRSSCIPPGRSGYRQAPDGGRESEARARGNAG